MNKQIYISPVQKTTRQPGYPKPQFQSARELQVALRKNGLDVVLKQTLKGGTMSQVYSALFNGKPVVVKHTEDMIPFDPTELFLSKEGHNIDTKVLKLLYGTSIRVPRVLKHFPDITTTIMEDLREEGFELLSSLILNKKLPQNCAENIGKSLANLAKISRKWKKFPTFETALGTVYERGLELRLAYPNEQKQYLEIEKLYIENSEYWVWPDAHPKNVLVKKNGEVAFIDFGRSHFGDQRSMLSNFLAHIVLYCLAGYIDKEQGVKFVRTCISAYTTVEKIDEPVFCKYFGMEILHRANGKWIEGISSSKQKSKLWQFGLEVFDLHLFSVKKLLKHLVS